MPATTSAGVPIAATAAPSAAGTKPGQLPLRYLRYLPAIYQEVESLLPSYLYPFEVRIDAMRSLLDQIDNYVTPGMTPADGFLPWLAGWVALTLDEEWEETRRRQLISQAVELYRWRGTVTGMRRYLELYTGLPLAQIEIHEGRWPGGMQIGMSSRIGGFSRSPAPAAVAKVARQVPVVERDYFVVTSPSQSNIVYVAADDVTHVEDSGDTVTIWRRGAAAPDIYAPAAVTRRNGLPEDRYELTCPVTGDPIAGDAGETDPDPTVNDTGGTGIYTGDTRLITEVKRHYCFIVRLLLSRAEFAALATPERLSKVRVIIEQEKPAHTLCYLRLDHYHPKPALSPMQIGVQSTIGLDTYLR